VAELQNRFQENVDEALKANLFVRNRNLIEKAWNNSIGSVVNYMRGKGGGQCGDFANWGEDWTRPPAEAIFGDGVIVDQIRVEEDSSGHAQALIRDPSSWADALYRANHAATRVILPNGEAYVLDYWQAVGDRQRGLYEEAMDLTHDQFFGGPMKQPEVRLVKESEWIKTWSKRIGERGDPAVVHNMNQDQQLLKKMIDRWDDEEKAFHAFRKSMRNKMPPARVETIIKNYQKKGLWWDKAFE
jgi:hypothetical protein